jgi:hypothetical protein
MSVPADTNTADVLELPAWHCQKCGGQLIGEVSDDIFIATCKCKRKWYIQITRKAGYYFEEHEGNAKPKRPDVKVAPRK